MEEFCRKTARGVEALAQELGLGMGPVYMNYAGREQDVLKKSWRGEFAEVEARGGEV